MSDTNIFSLPNPDQCFCVVNDFAIGHSIMRIKVSDKATGALYWLTFFDVLYYQGHVSWRGANFISKPVTEFREIMENTSSLEGVSEEFWIGKYKMFTVENENQLNVLIIASEGHLSRG